MTARKTGKNKPKVEKLELNKETVQELTEGGAEAAEGGQVYRPRSKPICSKVCRTGACPSASCVCAETDLCTFGDPCPYTLKCIIP